MWLFDIHIFSLVKWLLNTFTIFKKYGCFLIIEFWDNSWLHILDTSPLTNVYFASILSQSRVFLFILFKSTFETEVLNLGEVLLGHYSMRPDISNDGILFDNGVYQSPGNSLETAPFTDSRQKCMYIPIIFPKGNTITVSYHAP